MTKTLKNVALEMLNYTQYSVDYYYSKPPLTDSFHFNKDHWLTILGYVMENLVNETTTAFTRSLHMYLLYSSVYLYHSRLTRR